MTHDIYYLCRTKYSLDLMWLRFVNALQSSEVVGVIVLERCLVQLDDDDDQSLCSFVIGELMSASISLFMCIVHLWYNDTKCVYNNVLVC